jgi:PAS domain S-box-containing protein
MDFERKLKNKTIFAVMIVLLVLCAIYFSLGIKNQKQYIDWQIQKENDIVNIEIKNLLNTSNQVYRDKIQYFVNNPEIKKRFNADNPKDLYQKVFPFYTILKSEDPYHFTLNFYTKDNDLFLNMETGSGLDLKADVNSIVAKVNFERVKKTGFEFYNSSLYYKVVKPVIYKGEYIGCIEFGIRENEVVERITKDFDVTIASVFNPKNLGDLVDNFESSVSNEYFLIHSLSKPDVFSEIVSNNESLIPGKFEHKETHYYLDVIKVENTFLKEGFEGVIYFRDISALQNKFIATVYRSILIIFLILVSTFIILHFSFNALIHKIFNLQDSLDKRLAQKTKEIVNKNAELNQIFNTTGNSMRLIDLDHNIIRVNRAFTKLSGISKEDAEGKKCYNIFPGTHCHTSECPLNKIKNGEDRIEMDVKKKNAQGKVTPGILNSVAFKGQNGEVLGIIEDFKDISKRIEAEAALKRTEQQFSIFMDNLPLGVFIKDENLKSVYLNKNMDNIYSNENCQGKTPQEIFSEEYAKRVILEDKKVLNGEVLVVEDQLPDKKGNVKTYQTHKFRYRGIDNTWQIGGVSLDITEKKKTEQNLKILSNAIHHSPACVIITNLNSQIQFVNPSFTQITGYYPDDVINKEISLLNADNNSNSKYEEAMSCVLSGKDWQGEFHHQKKNGEKYWELASISPVKNDSDEISHFVIISEDITTRKKSEKELIDAKEKAEESNKLKTAFLANLSHEIRTPMNAIIGFSNLLLDQDMSYDEKVKLNSLINDNSHNLLKLIDDVIDISKIQAGDIEFNKTDCNLNKLLLDLYVSFSIKVENDNNKDIHLSLQKNTQNSDFSFLTDSARLKQILFNLIENAIKFTSKGFVEFGYSIIEEENKVQFYVIDSGIGISSEKFDMIYDLFRQADESFTREHGGTGIGLTIAKKLVDHLNGEIWIQSTPKQGTNIYFTLPLKEQEPKSEEPEIIPGIKYNWQNKVVLVADDINLNYQLIEEILSPTKATILWAKDGQEAVDLCLNNNNIDLVLMDINMPVMDGMMATKKIKEHNKELKIIGQTAYILENDREKCLNAGFDNYISKPIEIKSFLSSIDQIFSKN